MFIIRAISNSAAVGEMSKVGDAGAEVWECVGAATWWAEGGCQGRAVGHGWQRGGLETASVVP